MKVLIDEKRKCSRNALWWGLHHSVKLLNHWTGHLKCARLYVHDDSIKSLQTKAKTERREEGGEKEGKKPRRQEHQSNLKSVPCAEAWSRPLHSTVSPVWSPFFVFQSPLLFLYFLPSPKLQSMLPFAHLEPFPGCPCAPHHWNPRKMRFALPAPFCVTPPDLCARCLWTSFALVLASSHSLDLR